MIIDGMVLLEFLQKRKLQMEQDAEYYRRQSDGDQKERCDYQSVAYADVIAWVLRLKKKGEG